MKSSYLWQKFNRMSLFGQNKWGGSDLKTSLLLFLILVLTTLSYLPLLQNGFLSTWDDNRYILDNAYIRKLNFKSIGMLFSMYVDGHYHPFTLISLAIDYQIGGLIPQVYHFHNLLLHLLNTLLVFRFIHLLLNKEKRNVALLTALLFGIASIQVESVAWATERKNVLFALYYLLSLNVWLAYLNNKKVPTYLLALFFFILALLSKSMAIPLVFCLIALDYYYHNKWYGKKELLEKVPFLLLAICFGLIGIWAQKSSWGEHLSQEHIGFFERVFYAAYAFVAYAIKIVIPFLLSCFYTYPELIGSFFVWSSGAILLIIVLILLILRNFKQGGMARFGILFYIINIFLLLKLFEFPAGDYIMADRYAYVASIGIMLIIAYYGIQVFQRNEWWKRAGILLLVIYVVFVSVFTFKQVTAWGSDEDFYSNVIQQCPNAAVAYLNRGTIYQKQGRIQAAENDFTQAIQYGQGNYKHFANRGILYNETGQYAKAVSDLTRAARLSGNRPEILSSLGFSLMQTGKMDKALQLFNKVLKLQPDNVEVLTNRGSLNYMVGDLNKALSDYSRALEIQPDYVNAIYNRGLAYLNLGNPGAAISDFEATLKNEPKHAAAYGNLGVAWSRLGKQEKAFEAYNKSIALNPDNFEAYLNRGIDYYYQNENEKALADFNRCIQLNNSLAPAFYFKGLTLINLGRDSGCANLKEARNKGFEMAARMIEKYCK